MTDKQYDLYGRLSKVSLPYTSGTVLWNTYTYDGYDRPTKITAANGNVVTYSYSGTSTTETKNGIASTKQLDAAGNVTSITDAGGAITYNLRADGQPSAVIAPGNITTTFEYDQYGRRTKIVDPSAGTKTFGYDQLGNSNKETDANGKITNVVYDPYGRILSRTTPEISTTYSYNTDGLLQAETSNNGTGKSITYDALGRTVTFKETGTDGKWLQKGYTYTQGQVSTVSYTTQGGLITTETNSYVNGYLKKITLTGGQVIYDLQQENALGMATKVVSGPVTRNYSYDSYGMPTGRSAQTQTAGTYMNFTYSFNAANNNLNWRKDVTRSLTENFTYDNLNRLTGFGGQTVSYDAKGNITQKSGIGAFHYLNSSKPYALSGIVQSGSVIPQRQQQITYASFSRPLSITEDGYSAQFTYEAGGDRVKMHVTKSGALVLKRHYLADQYELDEKPGSTQEKLYLGGDYYSAGAVLVRDNGGAWQVYYVNSDYLGSITHVVNSAGSVVAEYSYDAWGRLRNPVNHVAFGSAQQPDLFLGRGYTGHEHLNWFGLINMNARLYDPVHGRFLAPDPYVQAPDFTQSFNRYGYAWNNPLIYTDPDGEFFWLAVAAFLLFTEPGYQIQKYISPVAVKIDIKFGTHQTGIGVNASLGVPKIAPYSKRWEYGATYFWKNYGGYKGWETRQGSEQSILGVYHWGKTQYKAGEFSQTVGFKSIGIPAILGADISNDYWGDGGDRYRTSHQRLNFFGLSIGGSVFTGDPGLDPSTRVVGYEPRATSKEYYRKGPYGDPDKYRNGILYVGIGPIKIGWDSEGIRHFLQNIIGHNWLSPESPWFRYKRYRPRPYIQFGWDGLW